MVYKKITILHSIVIYQGWKYEEHIFRPMPPLGGVGL